MRQLVLYVLASVFTIVVATGVTEVCGNVIIGCLAALILSVVPAIPGYLDSMYQTADSSAVIASLPMTYFSFGPIAGYPGSFTAVQILGIEGVSWERGMLVMVVSSCAVTIVAAIIACARSRVREARRCERHA